MWLLCNSSRSLLFNHQTIEGATATVHRTNTSCVRGAPGRLGGTRIVRRATTQEHVDQAWRGWAGDSEVPRTMPLDAKLLQQRMYIYIYIYIEIFICVCMYT